MSLLHLDRLHITPLGHSDDLSPSENAELLRDTDFPEHTRRQHRSGGKRCQRISRCMESQDMEEIELVMLMSLCVHNNMV